jgi:hypothetical protein
MGWQKNLQSLAGLPVAGTPESLLEREPTQVGASPRGGVQVGTEPGPWTSPQGLQAAVGPGGAEMGKGQLQPLAQLARLPGPGQNVEAHGLQALQHGHSHPLLRRVKPRGTGEHQGSKASLSLTAHPLNGGVPAHLLAHHDRGAGQDVEPGAIQTDGQTHPGVLARPIHRGDGQGLRRGEGVLGRNGDAAANARQKSAIPLPAGQGQPLRVGPTDQTGRDLAIRMGGELPLGEGPTQRSSHLGLQVGPQPAQETVGRGASGVGLP